MSDWKRSASLDIHIGIWKSRPAAIERHTLRVNIIYSSCLIFFKWLYDTMVINLLFGLHLYVDIINLMLT